MQISNVLLVLSATSASFATPVANSEQADFEAIAARYGIELTEAGARDSLRRQSTATATVDRAGAERRAMH